MNLFYSPAHLIQPPNIRIEGQEALHALKVLRYKKGDQIYVTDGRGSLYKAQILETGKNYLTAEILKQTSEDREKPFVTILIGIIKKRDRLEFAVEKCVELGAGRIILYKGDHSEKQNVRIDRIEAAVLSAMKQSLRYYLPETIIKNSLEEALHEAGTGKVFIADETANTSEWNPTFPKTDQPVLVVGPEGGFSDKERALLKKSDPAYCSLGSKRLRTETAAIVMVHRFTAS